MPGARDGSSLPWSRLGRDPPERSAQPDAVEVLSGFDGVAALVSAFHAPLVPATCEAPQGFQVERTSTVMTGGLNPRIHARLVAEQPLMTARMDDIGPDVCDRYEEVSDLIACRGTIAPDDP